MSEGVVDLFEAVEVDVQHCQWRRRRDLRQRFVRPFMKLQPVWQRSQRVAARQPFDLNLHAPMRRDVRMRGHPTSVGHRFVMDLEHPAVTQRDDGVARFVRRRDAFVAASVSPGPA
jgi:hypothetical protein